MHFSAYVPTMAAFAAVLQSAMATPVAQPIVAAEAELVKGDTLEKRGSIPFRPGTNFYSGTMDSYSEWRFGECEDRPRSTSFHGLEIKLTSTLTVYNNGSSNLRTNWRTVRQNQHYTPGSNPGSCSLFGRDKKWDQCESNSGSTSYSSYHGCNTRKYFDCLLQKPVESFYSSQFNRNVVYWKDSVWHNYRFYDNRNFAWFISCPINGQLKKRNGNRQPTKNPIWDFMPSTHRNEFADTTPLDDYATPSDKPLSEWVGAAFFWPPGTYNFKGVQCEQMAVSRPGLLHWTAIFY